jgi:hypothetical protein
MGIEMSKKERRPQAPKRRNFAAKHEKENPRSGAGAHRDRSKYNRVEDYWKDQLDDYVDDIEDDEDDSRERFLSKLKGEDYDPDMRREWEQYLDRQEGIFPDDYEDDDPRNPWTDAFDPDYKDE